MKLEKKLNIKLDNVIINNIDIDDYVTKDEYNSKVEELNTTKEDLIKTETELSKSQLELDSTKEILIEKESELNSTKSELSETQSELSDTKIELDNAKETLTSTKEELNSTKSELNEVTEDLNEANTKIEELKENAVNWSEIGYQSASSIFNDGFEHAKELYNNWDSSSDELIINDDDELMFFPNINTSNCRYIQLDSCKNLIEIPAINTSNASTILINKCLKLSNLSLPADNVKKIVASGNTSLTNIEFSNSLKLDDVRNAFEDDKSLKIIVVDTSKTRNLSGAFRNCESLESINLDLSNATDTTFCFYNCNKLKNVELNNAINVTQISQMFYNCLNLEYIALLDMSSIDSTPSFLFGFSTMNKLTRLEGFRNLHVDFDLSLAPNLTVDSIMNVINEASNLSLEGKTATLKLGSTNTAKLSEEQIAIASAKGWTLA